MIGRPIKIFLATTSALMLSVFGSVVGQADGATRQADGVTWQAEDFVISGDTVYGLSKTGKAKLSAERGKLVLPLTSSDGIAITKVGSFAFTPHKRKQIEDYTGRAGINGVIDDLDVDGEKIRVVGEELDQTDIKSVVIPEGYVQISQDAFSFNKSLTRVELASSIRYISDYGFGHAALDTVVLPSRLERIGDQAFFDNKLSGTLDLPDSLTDLGERAFKGNQISTVNFNNSKISQIKESAFEDNRIKTVTIPDSITAISAGAFNSNDGDPKYGYFVVIHTKSGKNSNKLPDKDNYFVDPGEDKKTTEINIDYSNWEEKDFTYDGSTVTGFSHIGALKVRQNKDLVIPDMHDGKPVTKIGENAFRNVDLNDRSLRKYDLGSVVIPSTVTEIGDFAFQSNRITELLFDVDAPLFKIGAGAFMNNRINMLSLPTGLQYIGDAAFHINEINFVLIPKKLSFLGRSAFRQNIIEYGVGFEEDSVLTEISEMAFAESGLTSVDLSNATKLTSIGVQAFAKNKLADLQLPPALERIEAGAFWNNQLTEVSAAENLKSVVFDAFDNNPGLPNHSNKVLITLPATATETDIADGENFVVAPNLVVSNHSQIEAMLNRLVSADQKSLRESTAKLVADLIAEAKELLSKPALSQGSANKFIFQARFFLDRINLDRQIKRSEAALAGAGSEADKKLLKEKLEYVKTHFNNAAWSEERVARSEHELSLLTDLVLRQGEMGKAKMFQGVYELKTPLPIPSYYIGVNVYFSETGTILYVMDRSNTIGEGQLDEYGNPIVNVDEDNEGYHSLALDSLADYDGKTVNDILSHDADKLGIRVIEKANYHRNGFYMAVLDAVKTYLEAESSKNSTTVGGEKIKNLLDKSIEKHALIKSNIDFKNINMKMPNTGV